MNSLPNDAPSNNESRYIAAKPRYIFDALAEYLEHLKECGATEVFLTAMTNPNIHGIAPRDPRADVYHAVLTARDRDDVISSYANATELTVTDALARREAFPALIEAELLPYIAAVAASGLELRRGRVEMATPGKKKGKDGESE